VEQRQRLHPLTPLVRSARYLVIAVAAVSWRGLADLGLARWLVGMVGVAIVAVGVSAVSWAVTGFQVAGRELRIYEGLLSRRTRTIPLERVQTVDVVRPFIARLLGLAELRIEVVGAKKTEAPLAYLSVDDAAHLRTRLIALVAGPAAESAAEAPAEQPVHAVNNRTLVYGQLLTPQAWSVPVGIAFVVAQAVTDQMWTFIGIASTLTALLGVFQVPVRRVLDDWNFRIATDPSGLRLRHGLLSTRSQTIPPQRVQAVRVTWPLLWRPAGWQRTRIDVAGYGEGADSLRSGTLLPIADAETTRRVTGQVLAGAVASSTFVDVSALPLTAPPKRARWLEPIARPYYGVGLTGEVVAARDGVLTRHLVVVPLARIQSVRITQGPLQRRLRLASVHVDTAGGIRLVGYHRDVDEAYVLAATLASRSRAARRRERDLSIKYD
jgi:putative membrane protein